MGLGVDLDGDLYYVTVTSDGDGVMYRSVASVLAYVLIISWHYASYIRFYYDMSYLQCLVCLPSLGNVDFRYSHTLPVLFAHRRLAMGTSGT